jgi:hypothetical protein
MSESNNNGCLGLLFLAGLMMFLVCNDNEKRQCQDIADAGKIMFLLQVLCL